MELPAAALLPARADSVFDWFARKTAHLLDVPVGLVSLVHAHGQVLPGAFGLPGPWSVSREMPLSHSMCQYVVRMGRSFVVSNTRDHPVVASDIAVTDLDVIAYAGAPLTLDNHPLGAICAIDHVPRRWTQRDLDHLDQIADQCSAELSARTTRGPYED